MAIALHISNPQFDEAEVLNTVADALRNETEQARLRRDHYQAICRRFEASHHLSSDEFLRQFEAGELGDAAELFDWFAAKRALDTWDRRYRLLAGIEM